MTHDYTYPALLKRWLGKALKPGASYTAKQACKCFYLLTCDDIGEMATRREIQLSGLTFPGWLVGVYAEYQQLKAQIPTGEQIAAAA